jgi:hypothetical protein
MDTSSNGSILNNLLICFDLIQTCWKLRGRMPDAETWLVHVLAPFQLESTQSTITPFEISSARDFSFLSLPVGQCRVYKYKEASSYG